MLRKASRDLARKASSEAAQYLKAGDKLHGFTLLRSKHIPELELTALQLQHDKTGADYIHIARDDPNNVFSIAFKTNPPDHTGVPHVLEHTTLCGSKKYPIRDPFFKMLPRTLSNFMNAMTASNYTYYPFSTTNEQDFKNLMSVYFDSTLHPLLKKSDFIQEGWRVGPKNPINTNNTKTSSLHGNDFVFKGVVYNEMKGQMSDSGYLYYIRFQEHIFPACKNSGGDPQKMTDLTYEQLKSFHAENYHPSNAKVFTYGSFPMVDHLKEINSQLANFEKVHPDHKVRSPIDLNKGSVDVSVSGPVDPLMASDMQFKSSTSWLMGDTSNVAETFALGIMSSLLMDGYGSPLYRKLIEAGLGTEWSSNTGFDTSGKCGIFSVGLTGVKEENVSKLKNVIKDTFREVHAKGFERSKVEGYLHQMEISIKHKTARFGMSILNRVQPNWFEGVDPFDSLSWDETISVFKTEYAKGNYLENLLEKYLLNDNTFTFTMIPSESYGKELIKEESNRLLDKISDVAKQVGGEVKAYAQFEKEEAELLEEQSKTISEDISCLPTVYVKDIPRLKENTVTTDSSIKGSPVQWRIVPTNGLTYFRAISTFKNLPDDLRELLPLFSDTIMRLGTKDMTTEQLEDKIKLKTGGLSTTYFNSLSPHDLNQSSEGLVFSGTSLDRNMTEMLGLLQKLVLETNFDGPEAIGQIKQLLQASSDGAVNAIASQGHSYAMSASESGFGHYYWRKEQVHGLSQLRFINSLANQSDSESLLKVIEKLKKIQQLAFSGSSFRMAITCGAEAVQGNEAALEAFNCSLPKVNYELEQKYVQRKECNVKLFYPLSYQVYYGALSLPTVPYTSTDSAPLQILAQILTHKHLHHEIREKGGAYGGGSTARSLDGVFNLYSYRDPNPRSTISIMQNSGLWAVNSKWSKRDIDEAKISVFQGVDAPKSVSSEGMARFLSGITDNLIQERRERLLDVSSEQVKDVAQKYIVAGIESHKEGIAFLGELEPWMDDSWQICKLGMNPL
ncbi:BgTH12-02943 [Blumeria graminis f. sp. triticale]|uniref:Presequence protease, mitochondrial n=1 Tax=Blumeria graminis f. sp. triticale TaxID=1689686 RepID=A0A9W4DNG6_BLUGR|nr:BgTH12-02943 [Blumeria graminis f. sp. triticale]